MRRHSRHSRSWQVADVELKLADGEVHVYLTHGSTVTWRCAECGEPAPLYDHQAERVWRHLDTCQYQTLLHAGPPRTQCPVHGVRVVRVPWAEPSSRFTALFERLAIEWLKAASQTAVAARLQLSWDEIHGIMDRGLRGAPPTRCRISASMRRPLPRAIAISRWSMT